MNNDYAVKDYWYCKYFDCEEFVDGDGEEFLETKCLHPDNNDGCSFPNELNECHFADELER